jgi:hypothetical protein
MSALPLPDALIIGLYWLLALLCCAFAAVAGGKSGRTGAAMIFTASVASVLGAQFGNWGQPHIPVMTIDLILLAGFYWLALRSESYWPIWATGFHLISVISHVAMFFSEEVRQALYFAFGAFWSLPVMMIMVICILRDRTMQWRES